MREEAEYDNIRRKEEVKNILLMDEACWIRIVRLRNYKKKLAKIGHFNNDKSFSRLSSEFDINVKLELRWRLKIILTNNIVANIYLIWWITSFGILKNGKNDVCRMTLNDSDAEKKVEELKQGWENFWNVCEKKQNMITWCDHSAFSKADDSQWI